ncbi:hypothetical protein [Amycolatopsis nigrescens]|uniref:hypothetical protein n=1 Tax=Amycolatopsis nigrescens TaxID=381445 RepID=UPI00036D5B9B|nr:hypothetical protein [Amycolatopsis nigrescens]
MTSLEFFGEPFDALAWSAAEPIRRPVPAGAAEIARELRMTTIDAHLSALRAQERLQLRTLPRSSAATAGEDAFKPLARTKVTRLDRRQLARLAAGNVAGVFGPAYDQEGANPDLRLGAGKPVLLTSAELHGRGLTATCGRADLDEVATQAAQLFALFLGLQLCFADAVFVRTGGRVEGTAEGGLTLRLVAADLVPRPWLRMRAENTADRTVELTVEVREKPGTPIGPSRGGTIPKWLARKGALLGEFHLAQLSRGEQSVALGPEYAPHDGGKAPRLPAGDLLFVDRVTEVRGQRGKPGGAVCETEYDSPADSWYYADTANDSMPNFGYLEMSLQAALFTGYYFGPVPPASGPVPLARNLGGTATVLREIDLRDKTIRQRSELLSSTVLPGSSLQSVAYTLSADGAPFYRGETMFGYFSEEVLAKQTGLDSGKPVRSWLDRHRPALRRIDLRDRRRDGAALCARGRLALLDQVDIADGGGEYGKGYLHSVRRIDPDDWFFSRHFPLDPVIPGSFGVESVVQAMQEWLIDSGEAAGLREPGFVLPAGLPFGWKLRGQFLPTDGECLLEVHLKELRCGHGRIRVVADASLWKPGLRIYELTDVAVELRERGAPPW